MSRAAAVATGALLALGAALAPATAGADPLPPPVTRDGARGALAVGILTDAAGLALAVGGTFAAVRAAETGAAVAPWVGAVAFGLALEIVGVAITHHGRVNLRGEAAPGVSLAPVLAPGTYGSAYGGALTVRF